MNNELNHLRYQIQSLKACHRDEVENECRLVVDAVNEVKARMGPYSSAVSDRAVNLIGHAMEVISQRRNS